MLEEAYQATVVTVGALIAKQARIRAGQAAIVHGERQWTFRELDERANRLARHLASLGIARGERICILSENSPVFVELMVAAARLGAIVATLNWRLSAGELAHCIDLVQPRLVLVSPRHEAALDAAGRGHLRRIVIGEEDYERRLAGAAAAELPDAARPEDGLLIVYTSGTTGSPKGALVSQRALIARMQLYCTDYGIDCGDTFLAWSPMFHMASADLALGTAMIGGKVVVSDGPDLALICDMLESDSLSNLIFFPGMVAETLAYFRQRRPRVRRVKKFGALADLFPPADIAALTGILGLPFTNTYACTECGIAPASAGRLSPGVVPENLAKTESSFCLVRLVDDEDRDVPDGAPGELVMRGPTVFSGYWNAPEANREVFRGGWFHTGDIFIRRPDGTLDYIDRKKYLIKSGGENIYPAEIERLVMVDPRVAEAVAIRRRDPRWGEVPVLVMARRDDSLTAQEVMARCAAGLARYKQPKDVIFVDESFFPRNNTGKILRHRLEAWIEQRSAS